MSDDPNKEPPSEGEQELQYLTPQFHEDEHLGSDSEADGNEEEDIAMITAGFDEDTSEDDVDDAEDDDFYDIGEFSDDDDGSSGGDSGF